MSMDHCWPIKEGSEGTLKSMLTKQKKEKKCHVLKG